MLYGEGISSWVYIDTSIYVIHYLRSERDVWGYDIMFLLLESSQIKATEAEPQQIVAQRLLSCLQYLVT